MTFENIWNTIQDRLYHGVVIPNWTKDRGYTGEPFKVVRVNDDVVEVKPPGARNIQRIPREDFQRVYQVWADYLRGKTLRSEIREFTRFSKYIISILHWIEKSAR